MKENHRSSKRRESLQTLANSNGLINNTNLDITEKILLHIPIEFFSRSRAVCKLWRKLLQKPKPGFLFAVCKSARRCQEIQLFQGYSDEVSIDNDEPISYKTLAKIDLGLGTSRNIPVKLIRNKPHNPVIFGSCNGLVCLPVRKDDAQCLVYICNPMTGEYVYLPEMDFGEISRPEVFGGFGYCQSTNEYKVVQVAYQYNRFNESGSFQVYALGDGSGWRNKGEIRYTKQERMVYANDALYWTERIGDYWYINVFDLAGEMFSTIPMPPCNDVNRGYKRLVSLNGCLCLCHVTVEKCVKDEDDPFMRKEDKRLVMWMLKKEQHKKSENVGYFPVDENDDSNLWVWIKEFSMAYKDWRYAQAIPHMNSFVSLEDLGEKSARYIPDDNEVMHLSQKV
ncbi:F-box protein At3g07870-like isoform X2 [Papaver somniferum]|uniref:F-box protein At3g07870-like isoform X2 n=1 Tax=Papaver somniferum TaxID=3469 RepID=UPI000E6FB085|nr:F-box protein At3g07870-like isoform X2 [Papaver somniferum]